LARQRGNDQKIRNFFLKFSISSLILTSAIVIFYSAFIQSIPTDLLLFILLIIISIPFYTLSGVEQNILIGTKQINKYLVWGLLSPLITFLMVVLFLYILGVNGVYYSIILTPALSGLLLFLINNKEIKKCSIDSRPLDLVLIKNILKFGYLGSFSILVIPLSLFAVRDVIVGQYGEDVASIWDAAFRVSLLFNLFLATCFSNYLVPIISNKTNAEALRNSISIIKLILVCWIVYFLIVKLFGDWVLFLLYDESFLSALDFLQINIYADLLKIMISAVIWYNVSRRRIVVNMLLEIIFFACLLFLIQSNYVKLEFCYLFATIAQSCFLAVYYGCLKCLNLRN